MRSGLVSEPAAPPDACAIASVQLPAINAADNIVVSVFMVALSWVGFVVLNQFGNRALVPGIRFRYDCNESFRMPRGGMRIALPGTRHLTVTLADIEAARRTIGAQLLRTPMLPAPKLSALTGAQVWVKYENLQVTNSFKERGAVAKLATLSAAERARGVIAMSAGNHAQAVAYHARALGIPATIVHAGHDAVREGRCDRGLRRDRRAAWRDRRGRAGARRGARRRSALVWVHPYDDPHVIAGQGTVALEMLEHAPDLDVLVIPIGGGGLIAGNAIAARAASGHRSRSSALNARSTPRCSTRCAARAGHAAVRLWPKGSR
jgi:threonine dehydratase